jgi:SAM-dependent methyltransferase
MRRRRDRAAAGGFADHDFLINEVAERLVDRLDDFSRPFADIAVLGSHSGQIGALLASRPHARHIVQSDLSPVMAAAARAHAGVPSVAADEEFLPWADQSFDLLISNLVLHGVNDLPGALAQIRRTLRPDGVFLASMFGGETLHELREVMMAAEIEMVGGASPRVSPMADVRALGNLLQRAGFALPVADSETITVRYETPFKLFDDLRGMAESQALNAGAKNFLRRDTLSRAAALYADRYAGDDGRVAATFEIVTLTAWAPHESQPKPLRPGSATTKLADFLAD